MPEHNDTPDDPQGRLSASEAAELGGQVAELAKAGLPLAPGLRALADELGGRRLRGALRDTARRLEGGATLEAAVEAQGNRFAAHVRGMILAGVRSGRLAEAMEQFVELHRHRSELWWRAWLRLAYPILLLVMLMGLFVFVQEYVVTPMARIYDDFDADLPALTCMLLSLRGSWTWGIIAAVFFFAAVASVLFLLPGPAWAHRLLYVFPVLGPVWRFSRLTEFSRLMALLLEQEVPLPEALRLAAAGLRDRYLAAACCQAAQQVEAGSPLSDCFHDLPAFPADLEPLADWGQRTPAMAEAFRAAAEMFDGRAEASSALLETVLPPLMFLMILVSFWFLVIVGTFMPFISLIKKLT